MTVSDILTLLQEGLDDDFTFFTGNQALPSAAQVKAAEMELGFPLPTELRELVTTIGCLLVEVKESVWPHAKQYEVRPRWQFEHAALAFGLATDAPPALQLVDEARAHRLPELAGKVPVFRRITSRARTLIDRDGVLWYWEPGGVLEQLHGGYFEELARVIRDLESDRNRLVGSSSMR